MEEYLVHTERVSGSTPLPPTIGLFQSGPGEGVGGEIATKVSRDAIFMVQLMDAIASGEHPRHRFDHVGVSHFASLAIAPISIAAAAASPGRIARYCSMTARAFSIAAAPPRAPSCDMPFGYSAFAPWTDEWCPGLSQKHDLQRGNIFQFTIGLTCLTRFLTRSGGRDGCPRCRIRSI